MLCYRLNINLAGGYVIFRSVPRIVAWATAAHSFPRDTACLFVYDCTMSYTWLLYCLLWWKLLYHVTCGWSLINKLTEPIPTLDVRIIIRDEFVNSFFSKCIAGNIQRNNHMHEIKCRYSPQSPETLHHYWHKASESHSLSLWSSSLIRS